MATVHLDTLTTLEVHEEHGKIVGLTREVLVTGLTETDWSRLAEALDTAGVPAARSSPDDYPNLYLVGRTARLENQGSKQVRIALNYKRRGGVFPIVSKSNPDFSMEIMGTMQQVETPFYADGSQIILKHTYPDSADEEPDENYRGKTIVQGGSVTILEPAGVITARGTIRTSRPHIIANSWLGYTNSTMWFGDDARTWLCTQAACTSLDDTSASPEWQFTFQFEYAHRGVDRIASFVDPRTGKAPPNLVAYNGDDEAVFGYRTIAYYPERDFNEWFQL